MIQLLARHSSDQLADAYGAVYRIRAGFSHGSSILEGWRSLFEAKVPSFPVMDTLCRILTTHGMRCHTIEVLGCPGNVSLVGAPGQLALNHRPPILNYEWVRLQDKIVEILNPMGP